MIRIRRRCRPRFLAQWALLGSLWGISAADTKSWTVKIPRTWDEAALADWATPVAGLHVRPTHISAKEYYSSTVENLQTYPFYVPGREPEGYWEMLQHVGPKPLIEPEKLKTEADWIEAGRRVFDEADAPHLRIFDPKLIAAAHSRETFDPAETHPAITPLPDGTILILR